MWYMLAIVGDSIHLFTILFININMNLIFYIYILIYIYIYMDKMDVRN